MLIDTVKNALAFRTLRRAGIFREMCVVDRGGEPQTMFVVKHHGVTSVMQRAAAVQLAKTMKRFEREDEFRGLVWSE